MKTILTMVRYQVFMSGLSLGCALLVVSILDFCLLFSPSQTYGPVQFLMNAGPDYFFGRGYFLLGGCGLGFWMATLMFLLPGDVRKGKLIPAGVLWGDLFSSVEKNEIRRAIL